MEEHIAMAFIKSIQAVEKFSSMFRPC